MPSTPIATLAACNLLTNTIALRVFISSLLLLVWFYALLSISVWWAGAVSAGHKRALVYNVQISVIALLDSTPKDRLAEQSRKCRVALPGRIPAQLVVTLQRIH